MHELPEGGFDAVFSATAFHWVEPAIGWPKVADVLADGGLLALLTHIAVHDDRSAAMEVEMVEVVRKHAPGTGLDWSLPPTLESVLAGAREQSANASAVWDGIMSSGRHSLELPEAAGLFTDVNVKAVLERQEQTADEVLAHLHTTSFWFMLEPESRKPFEAAYRKLIERRRRHLPVL